MTAIPVTTSFVALYAISLVILTGWVGLFRGKIGVLRGHGGNAVLEKRIRFHGNLTENAPATALVLAVSEMLGMTSWVLWLAICVFVAGRVIYFQLYDKEIRALAMILTQFPAGLLALWCLYVTYFS